MESDSLTSNLLAGAIRKDRAFSWPIRLSLKNGTISQSTERQITFWCAEYRSPKGVGYDGFFITLAGARLPWRTRLTEPAALEAKDQNMGESNPETFDSPPIDSAAQGFICINR